MPCGKTAIVTGGGSGLGAGIARKFAAEGAKVLVADINGASAAAVAGAIDGLALQVDVGDAASVEHLAAEAARAFGDVDILVNNAGVSHRLQPMEDMSLAEFDRVMSINARSIFLMAKSLLPMMKRARRGNILNIASAAAISPRPNLVWYSASKGWVANATRGMAAELAPFGIRVNAISPGPADTPLLDVIAGGDAATLSSAFLAGIPLGRFVEPDDIANAACYLCSDEAAIVTGAMLRVDGGRLL
jgi:3-oxoacyl-[acyl-carrier protein] reductase